MLNKRLNKIIVKGVINNINVDTFNFINSNLIELNENSTLILKLKYSEILLKIDENVKELLKCEKSRMTFYTMNIIHFTEFLKVLTIFGVGVDDRFILSNNLTKNQKELLHKLLYLRVDTSKSPKILQKENIILKEYTHKDILICLELIKKLNKFYV